MYTTLHRLLEHVAAEHEMKVQSDSDRSYFKYEPKMELAAGDRNRRIVKNRRRASEPTTFFHLDMAESDDDEDQEDAEEDADCA